MIEWGLRVAESRPGEIQKIGAREIRETVEALGVQDTPMDADIASFPMLNFAPNAERQAVTGQLKDILSEASRMGPIRRGLFFSLASSSTAKPESMGIIREHRDVFVNITLATSILGVLESRGFIDKDPEPQA
jgi:hypothetical protein